MSNAETNPKLQNLKRCAFAKQEIRDLTFVIHSSFVIRVSPFLV